MFIKVAQLRELCLRHNLSDKGLKKVLIERLEANGIHIEKCSSSNQPTTTFIQIFLYNFIK
jgi:hypothetical protein